MKAVPAGKAMVRKIAHIQVKPSGWAIVHFEDGCDAAVPPDASFEAALEVGEEHPCVIKTVNVAKTNTSYEQIIAWGSPLEGDELKAALDETFAPVRNMAQETSRKQPSVDGRDRSIMAQVALKEAQAMHTAVYNVASTFGKPKATEPLDPAGLDDKVTETAGKFYNFLLKCASGEE